MVGRAALTHDVLVATVPMPQQCKVVTGLAGTIDAKDPALYICCTECLISGLCENLIIIACLCMLRDEVRGDSWSFWGIAMLKGLGESHTVHKTYLYRSGIRLILYLCRS